MLAAQIVVLAKEPRPGLVKTRLTPALTPQQAAEVARAALLDTLDAVRSVDVVHRFLVLDGSADELPVDGFMVRPQARGGLDKRIAQAFSTAYTASPLPTLLVGMDTPQLTAELLESALHLLLLDGTDAVLGLADDGGWWALGLRRPDDSLLLGVPMSSSRTGSAQQERLSAAGLTCRPLPVLRDIDQIADLHAVNALAPDSRVAAVTKDFLTGSTA